jgi:hypothetical protein
MVTATAEACAAALCAMALQLMREVCEDKPFVNDALCAPACVRFSYRNAPGWLLLAFFRAS